VTVDDKNSSDGGREAGNRLVLAEKVKFIMGAISSPTAGVQTVSEPNNVLLFAQGAADSSLGPKFPLTFQVVSHFRMRTAAEYDWVVKSHPESKQVALVASDDLTGHDIARLARADAEKRGLTVVAEEYYPLDMTDFAPLVLRVLRNNPSVIDVGGSGARGTVFAPLVKSLTNQGYKGLLVGVSVDSFAFRDVAPLLSETFAVTWPLDPASPKLPPQLRTVLDQFRDKYGESEVEIGASVNYSTPLLLTQAMEQAGTVDDPVKVAEALRKGSFEAAWGKTRLVGAETFGLAVLPEQPIYMSTVINGQPVIIDVLPGTLP
jgi:ABC-type branched-subunit amino acid transport system substrate-binding protein